MQVRMTTTHPEVPPEIVAQLRRICLDLPEACEEAAWIGTRWSVRKHVFAHVLMINAGWPPAYARAAGSDGPLCVLTFRTAGREFEPFIFGDHPFFRPLWFANIVGLPLDSGTDWDAVAGYLLTSYRVLAPRRLLAMLS